MPRSGERSRARDLLHGVLLSAALIVAVDLVLRLAGLRPPDDPVLFHARTYMRSFSPFVETDRQTMTIRPDWVQSQEVYRAKRGRRAGRMFQHPGFRPAEFPRQKPPDTIRIFAFGGSSTFGQFVGAENAFPKVLERRLRELVPQRRVEVVNLGCQGLESTRVAILARQVLEFSPDLLIVYSGHNELLMGQEGFASAAPLPQRALAAILRASYGAGWLNYAIWKLGKSERFEILTEEKAALEAGKILGDFKPDDEGRQRPLTERYLSAVAENYAENVRSVIRSARTAGVPVLFLVPVANLLWEPRKSAYTGDPTDRDSFSAALDLSRRLRGEGRYAEALRAADEALAVSPGHARARFVRGLILSQLGRGPEALADFQSALDLDLHAIRVTSRLQATLADTVEAAAGRLLDLRPAFQSAAALGDIPNLFLDHCHPTRRGHEVIAERALPYVAEALAIAPADAAR